MANIWEKGISILAGNLIFFGSYGISQVDFRSSFIFWLRTRRKKKLVNLRSRKVYYVLFTYLTSNRYTSRGVSLLFGMRRRRKKPAKNHLVWFKMNKQQEEEKIKKDKQSDIRPKILCTCCKKLGLNFLKCCKPERYVHTEEKTSAEFFRVSY